VCFQGKSGHGEIDAFDPNHRRPYDVRLLCKPQAQLVALHGRLLDDGILPEDHVFDNADRCSGG
jgi:hypothetical protein